MIALDTFASQRTFRALLEALAHPGRILRLPDDALDGPRPAALAVPLALADIHQGVAVVGPEAERWGAHVAAATSCSLAAPADADLVVALAAHRGGPDGGPDGGVDGAFVQGLRRGSALAPEEGCRLTIACDELGSGSVRLLLRGPGVAGTAELVVGGVPAEVFAASAAANVAFPAGIDTFLVTAAGQVVGLPRSLSIEIQEVQ